MTNYGSSLDVKNQGVQRVIGDFKPGTWDMEPDVKRVGLVGEDWLEAEV